MELFVSSRVGELARVDVFGSCDSSVDVIVSFFIRGFINGHILFNLESFILL